MPAKIIEVGVTCQWNPADSISKFRDSLRRTQRVRPQLSTDELERLPICRQANPQLPTLGSTSRKIGVRRRRSAVGANTSSNVNDARMQGVWQAPLSSCVVFLVVLEQVRQWGCTTPSPSPSTDRNQPTPTADSNSSNSRKLGLVTCYTGTSSDRSSIQGYPKIRTTASQQFSSTS